MKTRQAKKIIKNIIIYKNWKAVGRNYKEPQWKKARKVVKDEIERFFNIYKSSQTY